MDYKQVIVVRKDLKMEKGKTAAQVAHGSLEAYKKVSQQARDLWEEGGSKKSVLRVDSLRELIEIKDKVKVAGIPYAVIRDAGKTQVSPGTITVLGIGPAESGIIDRITGKLKLL